MKLDPGCKRNCSDKAAVSGKITFTSSHSHLPPLVQLHHFYFHWYDNFSTWFALQVIEIKKIEMQPPAAHWEHQYRHDVRSEWPGVLMGKIRPPSRPPPINTSNDTKYKYKYKHKYQCRYKYGDYVNALTTSTKTNANKCTTAQK